MENAGPYIGIWCACLLIGAAIGANKGKGSAGAWLGALLGPLGILIIAIDRPSPETQARREMAIADARANLRAQPSADTHAPQPERTRQPPPDDPWGDSPMRRRT